MPMKNVRNPVRSVLDIDVLIRRAVQKSWDVQSNLASPITGGYRYEGEEVNRDFVRDEVKKQINRLVERALKDLDDDIVDYNVSEYKP